MPEIRRPAALDTARLTSRCWSNGWLCELCGARGGKVVLRATNHGHACMTLCPRCEELPEPLVMHTGSAAADHRAHIVRALDSGEIR